MKRAIDIVLLPPKNIIDFVVDINAKARKNNTTSVKLSPNYRIPHLPLLMGVLDDKNFDEVEKRLSIIAKKYAPLTLHFDTIDRQSFYTKNNGLVRKLHEELIKEINPLLTHDAQKKEYAEPIDYPFVEEHNHWVNEFVNVYSHDNFEPHITFHSPETTISQFPFTTTLERFAMCHLGVRNTCRTILAEHTLII